jgi:condensin complex subunit 1
MVSADLLARFFNLVGITSTKLLIYLNQIVVCEMKRRKMFKENIEKTTTTASKAAAKAAKDKRRSVNLKKLRRSIAGGVGNDQGLEEEMGLHGAEAEDVEVMFVESLLDLKVANPGQGSLIAHLLPACVSILKDANKYPDQQLQLACSMCLIRVMLLSQVLCKEHLQLIFTLMKKSPNPMVRSHLIIGIGDLVYRFPNALEPWTSHLYLPLRDTKSTEVRMNTIRVLSHLILKGKQRLFFIKN